MVWEFKWNQIKSKRLKVTFIITKMRLKKNDRKEIVKNMPN